MTGPYQGQVSVRDSKLFRGGAFQDRDLARVVERVLQEPVEQHVQRVGFAGGAVFEV